MTCLIAVQRDDRIYYGGDRCETSGLSRRSIARSKWIEHRQWAIGVAGVSKLGTLMKTDERWRSTLSASGEETPADVYHFAQCMQQLVASDPTWTFEKNEANPGGFSLSFVIAGPLGLFSIGTSFDVTEHVIGDMAAVGTGDYFALGAWEICQRLAKRMPMEEQITMCLESAAKHCQSVCAPFDVGSVKVNKNAQATK